MAANERGLNDYLSNYFSAHAPADNSMKITAAFVLALSVQFLDVITRLALPGYPIWHPIIFAYLGLAIICATFHLHEEHAERAFLYNLKFFIGLAGLAYIIPFINYLGALANLTNVMFIGYTIKTIVGFGLMFAPVFPLYFMYYKGNKITHFLGACYLIFWISILLIGLAPQMQTEGQIMGINPGEVTQKIGGFISDGWTMTLGWFRQMPSTITRGVQRTIAAGTGDVYTGRVDSASKQTLGVWMRNVRPSQKEYVEGDKVSISMRLEVDSLEQTVPVTLSCIAKPSFGGEFIGVMSEEKIIVTGKEKKRVHCTFDGLDAGLYTIVLKSSFPFRTLGYKLTYAISKQYKEALEDQGKDIFTVEKITKMAKAAHSAGPLMIGMDLDDLLAIGDLPEKISWGVTLFNKWQGKVSKVNAVYLQVPHGFNIDQINGYPPKELRCGALPKEEQPACDDTQVKVYEVPVFKIFKTGGFEDYVTLNIDLTAMPRQVLKGTSTPYNFKVFADYEYESSTKLLQSVKET